MSLLADLDVGYEREHGSAPVGAAPGVGVVEALIAGSGLALRHVADHIVPDFLGGEIARHYSGNWLDVGGEAFFDPVLGGLVFVWILGHGWEGHVSELVGDAPVGGELGRGGVLADAEASEAGKAVHVSPGGALDHSVTAGNGNDEDASGGDRKAAVVGGDGGSGGGDAGGDCGSRKIERAVGEVDLKKRCADLYVVGFGDGEMGAGLGVEQRIPPKQSLDGAPDYQEGEGDRVEARGHLFVGRETRTEGPEEQAAETNAKGKSRSFGSAYPTCVGPQAAPLRMTLCG